MGCRANCIGASLDSATNTCGIKLKNNCGSGCSGLTNGSSRIQIDANGNLVFCSNVGGTCSCVTLGSIEDYIQDNNDGTISHFSNAGNETEIDICGVISDTCDASLSANGGNLVFRNIGQSENSIDVCAILANCSIDDLGDVVISGPTSGQVLTYDGTDWVNDDVTLPSTDVCQIVADNCDIAVVDNGNGTFTITDIGGTNHTLNVCNMISDGGCSDSLTVLGSVVTHTALNGNVQAFDVCQLIANNCDVDLANNGDGTFTLTRIGGSTVTLDVCSMVSDGGCVTDICDIVASDCNAALINAGAGILQFTDNAGATNLINVCDMISSCSDTVTVLNSVVTHEAVDGTIVQFDICEIVADNCNPSLVNAGGGILQFTDVAGVSNNIDICAMIANNCNPSLTDIGGGSIRFTDIAGNINDIDICSIVETNCSDSLVDNLNGTYTHTAVDGTTTDIDICAAISVVDTNCIDMIIAATATGCSISAQPILSPDDCNGLECRANGLYLNNDVQSASVSSVNGSEVFVLNGSLPAACVYQGTVDSVTITNPSTCNNMLIVQHVEPTHIKVENLGVIDAEVWFQYEYDSGFGFQNTTNNEGRVLLRPGDVFDITVAGYHDTFLLAPGASRTLTYRQCIYNPDGNFTGNAGIDARYIAQYGWTVIN